MVERERRPRSGHSGRVIDGRVAFIALAAKTVGDILDDGQSVALVTCGAGLLETSMHDIGGEEILVLDPGLFAATKGGKADQD